ncbi:MULTISPECIES: CdaR family protein [Peribacillus]|jgi:YbbR domain-containing protein|uniref:CdaA regulatory protein CdaR n=1 Tax=Peribacillus simplex TaxID=1478 RepID=A0A9W4L192_9BACI|nr:CdaR family protein [Peribacillus simplex]MDR4928558.1 CdaR family protein [Peribacillus simplex]CAH0280277.1 CdaA regulatory protein CdaR [Peribacillus simplex]
MDKFTNSAWFMRIVAFALAALLFISINFEMESDKKSLGLSTAPEISTETIENVPVEVYYDRENLVVSGVPETVDVTLKGAKSLLINAKNQRDFKVYVDLSDPAISMGDRTVTFKISDLNEKLVATIDPEYAEVNVQERVTKEFSVEAEYNSSLLEEGYTAGQPTVSPKTVKITGAKDAIEQISYVKANLEISKGLNETVNGKATVKALDRDLNKLDVTIEPSTVSVSLKVSIPSKTVSIAPKQIGKAKDGIRITSVSVDPKEVTLFGSETSLEKIDEVNLPVNISKIDGDTELELDLDKPESVQKMSLGKAKVKIRTEKVDVDEEDAEPVVKEEEPETEQKQEEKVVEEEAEAEEDEPAAIESKTFNNIQIVPVGIQDDQNAELESDVTSITLLGEADDLKKITKDDINLTVDVSNLDEGTHDVDLAVTVPEGVDWELDSKTISVTITQKDEET